MAGGAHLTPGEEGGEEFIEDDDDEEDDDPVQDLQRIVQDMDPGSDDNIKKEAMHLLKQLYIKFKCGYGITCAILKAGAIKPLVVFVTNGTDPQKEQAAELLSTLAYTSRFGLVSDSGLKAAVRSLGGYKPLADIVVSGEGKRQEHAAAALENLGVTAGDREEIAEACGGCGALVTMVKEGSVCQKELAVRILRAMLVDGHQEAIEKASGVISLYVSQVEARGVEGEVVGMPEITVC